MLQLKETNPITFAAPAAPKGRSRTPAIMQCVRLHLRALIKQLTPIHMVAAVQRSPAVQRDTHPQPWTNDTRTSIAIGAPHNRKNPRPREKSCRSHTSRLVTARDNPALSWGTNAESQSGLVYKCSPYTKAHKRLGLCVWKACYILLEPFPDPPETRPCDNAESNPVEYLARKER